MLSDYELICHRFPGKPDLKVYPIGDVHLGAAEHMAHEWQEFCRSILEDENAYLILLGDLMNNSTRSSVSNVFEEVMRPRDQKKLIAEQLRPLRERILGMVSGNHERRSGKDADNDPSLDIAAKLDIEDLYRRDAAFIKIQMGNNRTDGFKNPTYILACTHGAAGGRLTGNAVNRAEQFGLGAIEGADALIVGHSHKPFVTKPGKIVIDPRHNIATIRPLVVVSCTSWLRFGGYAMQKMLLPSTNAPQIITLRGNRKEISVEM